MDCIRTSKKRIRMNEKIQEQGSMKRKTLIWVTLFVIFEINCFGQSDDFKDILTHPIKNRTILQAYNGTHSERTFLGLVKDSKGKVVFYVAKEVYTVQAAVVRHGHSRIIFFDRQKRLIASYWTDSELPYVLANNTMYFKYENSNSNKRSIYKERIGPILPDHICVKKNECYTAEIVEEKNN